MTPPVHDRAGAGPPSLLVIISAPSGAGKTTLCQQLLAARPGICRAITCTTRPARAGERDGIDYYFLDSANFERKREAGEFLESAHVYGNSYGTLKSEVFGMLRNGKDALLSVDVQGAEAIRALARSNDELRRALVMVFLTTASLEILENRLRKRASDPPAAIERRLKEARAEMERWREFDFVIVSSSIEEDLRRMVAIIEAEKMRADRLLSV